jgi:hypothetical protein
MEEEAMPFPNEERTPPVMKMYFDVFGTGHPEDEVMDGLKTTDVRAIGQRVCVASPHEHS